MREAASIAPGNARVQAAFSEIQRDASESTPLQLCRRYFNERDAGAGKALLQTLQQNKAQLPREAALECTRLLLEGSASHAIEADEVLAYLLINNSDARSYLGAQLGKATTNTLFEEIWDTGDRTTDAMATVLLDASVWSSEEARHRCERDVFMLLLAKVMEAGQDHLDRGLRGLARLLSVDANRLQDVIDADCLEVILCCLDNNRSLEVRSQATLVVAKYLEASQETGQRLLSRFFISRVTQASNEHLIVAFSAAAAMFPVIPATASSLFLTEGLVDSLLALLIKKAKGASVKKAALEMLSAACVDRTCRDVIRKHFSSWLDEEVSKKQGQTAELAAVVLAKVRTGDDGGVSGPDNRSRGTEVGAQQLVGKFKEMIKKKDNETKQAAIEGLAYTSLQPQVKEDLAKDGTFLKNLVDMLRGSLDQPTVLFGGLAILSSLTKYAPVLSEEQKRISQLQAYANTSKPKHELDPLDDDEHVTARCKALIDADILPVLAAMHKKLSSSSLANLLTIILSLSKEQKHRGKLAQQGAVKLLLQSHASMTGDSALDNQARRTAAHALARILISVNPTLVFSSSSALPISSAVRPLASLLEDDPAVEQRDLLPTFEALLALTNLASTDDPTRDAIVRLAWPRIEDLLLSRNTLVQRAAVELVCNLVASEQAVASLFGDGTGPSVNRLHILLALADVDDYATRRAAAGALAMLTEWDGVVEALLKVERAVKVLIGLCGEEEEEEEELRLRAVVCLRNIVCTSSDAGKMGMERVKKEGGLEVLKDVLDHSRNQDIVLSAAEALKVLMG